MRSERPNLERIFVMSWLVMKFLDEEFQARTRIIYIRMIVKLVNRNTE